MRATFTKSMLCIHRILLVYGVPGTIIPVSSRPIERTTDTSKETSMDTASPVFPQKIHWETSGTSRIPFMAYTQADQHRKELERLFYRKHWCYVGLEAEIPEAGDFKRTVVGERSVIMVRDADGVIHVVENVCAHRGMQFCRSRHGNAKASGFTCPYH